MSMAKWTDEGTTDGIITFRLSSWSHFFDFLEEELFSNATYSRRVYVWRGQRRADWSLSTTLDRLLDRLGILLETSKKIEDKSNEHLSAFKYAARGRRGTNPSALSENEWWALGQHFGLATPLLDWTRSPFAAAYFAFEELATDHTLNRVVYALDQRAVIRKNEELEKIRKNEELGDGASVGGGRLPTVEFIEPLSDDNQRLVSQGGCFTRAPVGVPIEIWISRAFEASTQAILWRIEIPDADRSICLRALNRMNINHLSLFPDLIGASRSTNLKMELEL
jgi:hypothetical protein